MRRFHQRCVGRESERGQVLVLATLFMAVLLGFAALTIDGGQLYRARRQLQNGVDAGAHAGAQVLPDHKSDATAAAYSWAANNTVLGSEVTSVVIGKTWVADDTITVSAQRNVPFGFARVLGRDSGNVTATAKVAVGSVVGGKGIFPFGLVDLDPGPGFGYQFNQSVVLREAPGNFFGPGNYGFLNLDGRGGDGMHDLLANGGSRNWLNVGDNVGTLTGQKTGPVVSGLEDWATHEGDSFASSECANWDSAHEFVNGKLAIKGKCKYRVILIPIINYWPNGNKDVTILGFAQMYLVNWTPGDGKRLDAVFLQDSMSHPEIKIGAVNGYGTRVVKFIN